MSHSESASDIVVLCSDLFSASEIRGTAELHGQTVRIVDTDAEAVQAVTSHPARLLIVDLRNPGLDCEQLVARLPEKRPRLLGFYPHVQTRCMESAAAAGFDEIVTRGQFSTSLVQWIS